MKKYFLHDSSMIFFVILRAMYTYIINTSFRLKRNDN